MDAPIKPDQYLIIIGSMKCGTTSLFDYLGQHPALCPSSKKATEHFSENQKHQVEVSRYEDFWPDFDPEVHRYALEKLDRLYKMACRTRCSRANASLWGTAQAHLPGAGPHRED